MLHDVQRVGTLAFSWPGGPLARLGPGSAASTLALARSAAPAPFVVVLAGVLVISAFLASTAARASRTRVASAPSSLLVESVPASNRSNAAAPNAALRALDLALELAQLQLQLLGVSGSLALSRERRTPSP